MSHAPERIRTLLLRGDNLLKSGKPERLPRAVEAFEQAAELADDPAVDERVRELVRRRLEAARALAEQMEHSRHYTVEEAAALLPHVVELIERMRSARDRLGDAEARAALAAVGGSNGGGEPGKTVSEGFLELRESVLELRELEIVLRDLDRGLVDFPALRDGREVYLCWQEGEPEIGFWHEPDTGFAGRRPLADG